MILISIIPLKYFITIYVLIKIIYFIIFAVCTVKYYILIFNQIISSNLDFKTYTVTENKEVSFDPSVDIVDQGIRLGTYTMVYNFQRPVLTINPNLDLFLKTISQDRTEVKIATTTDNNTTTNATNTTTSNTTNTNTNNTQTLTILFSLIRILYQGLQDLAYFVDLYKGLTCH